MSTTPYATVSEAQNYFDEVLNTESWDAADTATRNKALKTATRLINTLNYIGSKADAAQENAFPRNDDTTVPTDIVNACCEITLSLLDGVKPGEEIEALMVDKIRIGETTTEYNRENIPIWILAGIPNSTAWAYLKPYLRDWTSVELHRG